MNTHYKKIASELSIAEKQVSATVELLDEGATVPFISRYRKELTGSLDEVQVANIRDRVQQLRELDKRREAILKSLAEMGKLTPELDRQISEAETMVLLEDIYLPYRPKRKTRATPYQWPHGLLGTSSNSSINPIESLEFILSRKCC